MLGNNAQFEPILKNGKKDRKGKYTNLCICILKSLGIYIVII